MVQNRRQPWRHSPSSRSNAESGACLNCLADYPVLAVEQRYKLREAALWPAGGTTLPGKPPAVPRPRASPRERECAVDLVRDST